MSPSDITIRAATKDDVPLILSFIRKLAEYERLAHEVVATERDLRESLFGAKQYAEGLLAFVEDKPAGFALYFHNYSTFLGRPGIYLEDLFVEEQYRGRGIGRTLLTQLARIAVERNCGRLEWWVLDWNEPAIEFYKKLGAVPMSDFTVFRLAGEALRELANHDAN